jgi:anthranilate phosphoribosyltransferase
VFDAAWVEPLAAVLQRLGSVHALIVHGHDGLDEISLSAPTDVAELQGGSIRRYGLEPDQFGLARCRPSDLQVASAAESASIIRRVLEGIPGAARDVVLLNAGAAIYICGVTSTIATGIERAREVIDRGTAGHLLERAIQASAEAT